MTLDTVPANEETVTTLVAIAMRVVRATGLYLGADNGLITYITIGDVTLTTSDGETSTVTISIDG